MRNILLAILVSSSALLTGCTDDLATDEGVGGIEAQPLDETFAATHPELAAQTEAADTTERAAAGALADGTDTNVLPCPSPTSRVSPNGAQVKADALSEGPSDICAQLPEDGACALACDPEALVDQFIPKGTCVTFRCELTSGQVLHTGGCNP